MTAKCNVTAYYDNESRGYWVDTPTGWRNLGEGGLIRHLRADGYGPQLFKGHHISPIDREILRIQTENAIDYAGPLAGWNKGVYDSYGYRLLVTHSPKLLIPTEGNWQIWQDCLESMYNNHPLQLPAVYSWYKAGVEALYNHTLKPGQMKFSFGKNDSGKNFEQNRSTIIFGGRVADPWRYMSGRTDFNRELFGAEHLIISDPDINCIKDKLDLAIRIKQFTVNEVQSCHGKNREAFSARPFWRVDVTSNSEIHNMAIMSVSDGSVLEKVFLLLVSDNAIPPTKYRDMGYDAFREAVDAQLPHFVWFLLNQWKIPASMENRRFGVKAFHHPEIIDTITDLTKESKLRMLLDDGHFFDNGEWTDSVSNLAEWLQAISSISPEASQFSKNINLISYCLSKLSEQYPTRFRQLPRTKNKRLWNIKPPINN